ncbi:DUF58 domain-containing protein [Spongiibacter nanhainus]|uniref:DUF58 domain-containing protein n=1 Tax=Spongiibacter nanhainus TaxID=2794344 RepID=A0A7T4QZ88_9GAMM|nr:DUF58 domain-containing protein [Spongiibacter nanhainus]QQD17387.1 DUF58 domain-containing protein [Spongiibacter nanhainus]
MKTAADIAADAVRGAYVDQQALIRSRFAARRLRLQQRRHYSRQSGQHPAPFKGRGLAFNHVREYQGGDEIRHIDWRVTARTTQAHTKIFEEEKERPIVLCLDQSQSMFFGSRHCFKSVLACHCAALLAWSALDSSDRVGGLIFDNDNHREIRPRRNQRAVLHFLHSAAEFNQRLNAKRQEPPQLPFATALEELRRITRPGSSVFVLSDFQRYDDNAERQLHLLARHNDVIAAVISDPLERELPGKGQYPISDGEHRLSLSVTPKLQQRYRQQAQQRIDALQHSLRRGGIHYLALSTNQALTETLDRELRLV